VAEERAGFWATIRAVLWSFVGIRRKSAYQDDARSLDPKAVVVAGVLAGVVFVLGVLTVVNWVLPD
jgi:amino acid transporter